MSILPWGFKSSLLFRLLIICFYFHLLFSVISGNIILWILSTENAKLQSIYTILLHKVCVFYEYNDFNSLNGI